MILPSREITSYDPAELNRGIIEYAGWTVRPVGPFQLDVVHAAPPQRTFRITLDEVNDRRWKSYSFIPPGPEHAQPTVAVGCEAGVWFYRLDNGRPTRLYSGHSGPVYCLAPSPRMAAGSRPAPPTRPCGSGPSPTATRRRPWGPRSSAAPTGPGSPRSSR